MSDQSFRCLFLGENHSWLKLSQALVQAPSVSLYVQRTLSLTEAFRALSAGPWDALALDLHAWSLLGLRSIQTFRSEHPTLPILALFDSSVIGLHTQALRSGASRCLSPDSLSAEAIHTAILSANTERKSQTQIRTESQMDLGLCSRRDSALLVTRAEIVAHAVNNLLCVINANADVLADRFADSDPAVRRCRRD
jgi:DNA-binding NarL/FixJ family response regulator